MGAVIGFDAGNSKTELVVAGLDGTPTAYVRGHTTSRRAVETSRVGVHRPNGNPQRSRGTPAG